MIGVERQGCRGRIGANDDGPGRREAERNLRRGRIPNVHNIDIGRGEARKAQCHANNPRCLGIQDASHIGIARTHAPQACGATTAIARTDGNRAIRSRPLFREVCGDVVIPAIHEPERHAASPLRRRWPRHVRPADLKHLRVQHRLQRPEVGALHRAACTVKLCLACQSPLSATSTCRAHRRPVPSV